MQTIQVLAAARFGIATTKNTCKLIHLASQWLRHGLRCAAATTLTDWQPESLILCVASYVVLCGLIGWPGKLKEFDSWETAISLFCLIMEAATIGVSWINLFGVQCASLAEILIVWRDPLVCYSVLSLISARQVTEWLEELGRLKAKL